MPFLFDVDYYQGKMKEKYLQAQLHTQEIHQRFPEIKEADEILNQMQRDLRLMKAGILPMREEQVQKKEGEVARLKKARQSLLKRHGIPINYKEPQWDCPQCQDTGRIYSKKAGDLIPCPCAEERRFSLFLAGSNLPRRLQQARFERASFQYYSQEETVPSGRTHQEQARLVHERTKNFVNHLTGGEISRGLLIYGPVGSGKSYLLGCIANEAIYQGLEVRYLVYSDLLEELRHTFSKKEKEMSSQEIIQKTQEVPLLLIDDLGTESSSDFTANTLYSIIDYRYREEKPLVITTNLEIDRLKDKFSLMGERISQRILEMCEYLPLMGEIRLQIKKRGVNCAPERRA